MKIKPIVAAVLAASSLCLAAPAFATTLASSLDGPSVPTGGDGNGWADFVASIDGDNGRLCYRLETHNVDNQTIAHIHEGSAGDPGRPLINLTIGSNSCTNISASLMQDILDNPSNYYVDVLSSAFPKGAVRGQLALGDPTSVFSYNGN